MSVEITKRFPLGAVLSLTTGKMLCGDFSKAHDLAEHVLGHPMWNHEFASPVLWDKMRDIVLTQHPQLVEITGDGVTPENYAERMSTWEKQFGTHLFIVGGSEERTKHPLETLREMTDKPIIAIEIPAKEQN